MNHFDDENITASGVHCYAGGSMLTVMADGKYFKNVSNPEFIISSSFGNDSIALIELARREQLENVHVVYCNTGWEHESWIKRVEAGSNFAAKCGFFVHNISGDETFLEMVRRKKGFPNSHSQFCSKILKCIPFLQWCEANDPQREATIVIGKRRDESRNRKDTPTHEWGDKYYKGRLIWYPLAFVSELERDEIVKSTPLAVLPHRSMECSPCVNATRKELLTVTHDRIKVIKELEKEIGHQMFRTKTKMGADGIEEVMLWARSPSGRFHKNQLFIWDYNPCITSMCGTDT